MLKRITALLLALCLILALPAFAEGTLHADGEEIAGLSAEEAAMEEAASRPAYETIKKGEYGDHIVKVQERLRELGFLKGEADGSYWTQTSKAIIAFEQANFLTVTTDRITGETLEILFSDEAVSMPETVCKRGERNDEVLAMQDTLYAWGFLAAKPDGKYNDSTAEALAAFQNIIWEEKWTAKHKGDGIPYSESGITADGGSCDIEIYGYLTDDSYDIYSGEMKSGDSGAHVLRLQNLLDRHGYLFSKPDGDYGGFTEAAVKTFQKAHGLEVTGIADEATQRRLMQDDITDFVKPDKLYRLVVDVDEQLVYAYAWDGDGYNNIVRSMICSTGTAETPTPLGVYTNTSPQDAWHHFYSYNCWAQYSYVIQGHIMFHSVLYTNATDEFGEDTHGLLVRSSLDNLGTRQSHGCVRLKVEDAKWIFLNCPKGTEVEVIQLVPDPIVE